MASGQRDVIAGVRNAVKAQAFHDQGVGTVILDLNDVTSIRNAMRGIDRVFLFTGYTVEMLVQRKMIVDRAPAAGVDHLVHMGAWVPDDTDLPHFAWHQMIERYIAGSGLGWTHLAPGMFMQNLLGDGSLWGAFDGGGAAGSRAVHAFTGRARLGWIAAEDIARVAVAALQEPLRHAGRKYNLSVEVRSVPEIAAILSSALGSRSTRRYISQSSSIKRCWREEWSPIMQLAPVKHCCGSGPAPFPGRSMCFRLKRSSASRRWLGRRSPWRIGRSSLASGTDVKNARSQERVASSCGQ